VIDPGFVRLHADAMGVLSRWDHPEPQQRMLRDAYLTYLREHPDAMSRESRIGHLTASALVMDQHRTRVLLTLHPKVGRWLQLGGHVEIGDASLQEAARRETIEESGIADVVISGQPLRLDRHPVPCGGAQSEHLDVQYLALVAADARAVMSDESDDLRWFDVTALPEPLDPSVRALIDTALTQSGR
jgi:8-oxo-dGTP pyrophosphatase MutT (NUDIX family)